MVSPAVIRLDGFTAQVRRNCGGMISIELKADRAAVAAALNKLQEGRWGDIQWDKPPNSHRRDISATKFSGN